jgi:paraquat-inducible protein B
VELVFRPETEVRLVGGDRSRTEIPTIHSEMEQLIRTIEDLPVKEILTDARSVLARLNEILSSPEVKDATVSIAETTKSLSRMARRWDEKSDAIFDAARDLIVRLDGVAKKIEDGIDPIVAGVEGSAEDFRTALESARRTLDSIERTVRGDSSLVRDTRTALQSLSRVLDSVRVLADYLERHPEALLKGKSE